MIEKKLYKPNVVYVVEIHGYQYYIGCLCHKKEIIKSGILYKSGNPLRRAYNKKLITAQEYKECCRLVHFEEYDTKEEALNREAELIQKFKEHYGDLCINQSPGNKYGPLGRHFHHPESSKRIMSEKLTNRPDLSKRVFQFTKDGQFVAEYPSVSEASRQTGCPLGSIAYACRGKRAYARGYIWKYA